MKYVQSITFRAMSALLVGALLVAFPDRMTTWLVMIIGVLFLIPGIVSIIGYFKLRSETGEMRPLFPVVGIGSILFGIVLLCFPESFVMYLIYILAAFLLLAGASQIVALIHIRKFEPVHIVFYVFPVLISLAGIFILVYPKQVISIPFIVFGVASITYGLVELFSAIHFRKIRRIMITQAKKNKQEASEASEEQNN